VVNSGYVPLSESQCVIVAHDRWVSGVVQQTRSLAVQSSAGPPNEGEHWLLSKLGAAVVNSSLPGNS